MDCDSIQEWCVLLHGHSAIQRFFFSSLKGLFDIGLIPKKVCSGL